MQLVKDKKRVDLYPESKKERDLIMKLWDSLRKEYPDVLFEFMPDSEGMNLSILLD